MDHARAQDAVHAPFQPEVLQRELGELNLDALIVHTAATDRLTYLQRPDLGRRLGEESRRVLGEHAAQQPPVDLAIIVSDGLSAPAAHRQAVPLLNALLSLLREDEWSLAPIVLAPNARVAVQDEAGDLLKAALALILLGERPGLGSPDSLGAYLVYEPRPGRTDADRNCVSNIRPQGLPAQHAARRIFYLLKQARRHRLSGVALKDESELLDRAEARRRDGELQRERE